MNRSKNQLNRPKTNRINRKNYESAETTPYQLNKTQQKKWEPAETTTKLAETPQNLIENNQNRPKYN